MYVGAGCCDLINREPSPDDIEGAQSVYGLSATPACDNGIDDDGDGDYDLADSGCKSATDLSEVPDCNDGIDNDYDGLVDFDGGGVGAPDPGCTGPNDARETAKKKCGLGFELSLALLPLWMVRRSRARTKRAA
jgi:hypothetical protein